MTEHASIDLVPACIHRFMAVLFPIDSCCINSGVFYSGYRRCTIVSVPYIKIYYDFDYVLMQRWTTYCGTEPEEIAVEYTDPALFRILVDKSVEWVHKEIAATPERCNDKHEYMHLVLSHAADVL